MPFTLFRDRFRDLDDREARTFTRRQDSASDLLAGQYAFVESFCDEPGCDCRRVLFTVIDTASGRCEAVINFGWKDASFYAAWLREDDPHMVAALQGPALQLGPTQGRHAHAILDVANGLVLHAAYVARVKRHYAMFREDVEKGNKTRIRPQEHQIRPQRPVSVRQRSQAQQDVDCVLASRTHRTTLHEGRCGEHRFHALGVFGEEVGGLGSEAGCRLHARARRLTNVAAGVAL